MDTMRGGRSTVATAGTTKNFGTLRPTEKEKVLAQKRGQSNGRS